MSGRSGVIQNRGEKVQLIHDRAAAPKAMLMLRNAPVSRSPAVQLETVGAGKWPIDLERVRDDARIGKEAVPAGDGRAIRPVAWQSDGEGFARPRRLPGRC